jgi:LPS-assembly protein
MLGGEFRYLSSISEGQIAAEVIDDSELNEARGQFSIQNKVKFSPRLTTDVDLNYVSDDDYLEDFGNSLSSSTDRYVKSHAKLNYNADAWTLLANIDNYDSIDESISSSTRPHRRLPQLLFNLKPIDVFSGSKFNMRNEFVYFDHSADVRGKRLDLQPSISHNFRSPSGFITPKASLRYTNYRLENQGTSFQEHQDRTLPILSVDSGLYFEREVELAGGMTQTLEPRAFYLYVPHKNQDDIPLFDSSEYDFSFNQLFRDNRFSGTDRVADANQLTLAVTSRFIEQQSGRERLRASIGTIIYFDDLDVTLNSTDTGIKESSSDIVGELAAKLSDHWSARSSLQYDPHSGRTEKSTLGFHYRDGENKLFNATYRSRFSATDDDIEQTDVSFKWPLSESWSTVGRWNYSEEHNLSLETFLGLEKDTCCWRFRVLAKRYVNDAFDEEPNEGLFFQLQFKGLTSFGNKVESVLEEAIGGYTAPEY